MNYRYKAMDIYGKIHKGNIEAVDYQDLWMKIRQKNLFLISYSKRVKNILTINSVSQRDLAIFNKEFYLALKAGINIEYILKMLSLKWNKGVLKECMKSIGNDVKKGVSLSESMRCFKNVFPSFMIDMINIGEESGKLEYIFKNLSVYYYKEFKYKNRIINASIYPLIVLFTTVFVTHFLLVSIIPVFMRTFSLNDKKLPFITKILIDISNFAVKYNYLIISAVFVVPIIIYFVSKLKATKNIVEMLKLRLPFIKKVSMCTLLFKIFRELELLFSSGVNLLKALQLISNTLDNVVIKKKFSVCVERLKMGCSVSDALESTQLFDNYTMSILKVGEETGKLELVFTNLADIYEEMLDNFLRRIIVLIEPILILILSLIVGTIVIAFVIPIFDTIYTSI
ncbi:putative type II secretion system protein F [Clostridium tepidiprofundi DSM 19306]|uniref:Putative type II secretion system protein F n=1 Tax=Clostridium tepidiprofundi DSM 19306 TaxID=1121338 RepID=A0A151B709_9CLOT|nr:type II secretion system F family protein [Clostridium tepidiprofundi]KYH35674.1 putative type II secretion system protein F [Clostridium tepidiprofundi DSM 19306]